MQLIRPEIPLIHITIQIDGKRPEITYTFAYLKRNSSTSIAEFKRNVLKNIPFLSFEHSLALNQFTYFHWFFS